MTKEECDGIYKIASEMACKAVEADLAALRAEIERLTHDRCQHGNPMCMDCHGAMYERAEAAQAQAILACEKYGTAAGLLAAERDATRALAMIVKEERENAKEAIASLKWALEHVSDEYARNLGDYHRNLTTARRVAGLKEAE